MILISGGNGFLGQQIGNQLKKEHLNFRSLDFMSGTACDGEFILGDMRDKKIALRACDNIEIVIHSAAIQYHSELISKAKISKKEFWDINVKGTETMVLAAIEKGVKGFIYISSDMVYGIPLKSPISEDADVNPIGTYGKSKLAGEKICLHYMDKFDFVTIIRPRVIVGPGRVGLFNTVFNLINTNKLVPIVGKGDKLFQLASVYDVAKASILSATKIRKNGIFNIGSDKITSIEELIYHVIKISGSNSKIIKIPYSLVNWGCKFLDLFALSPLHPEQYLIADKEYILDINKAKKELNWTPTESNLEMIENTWKWYLAQQKSL